VVIAVLGLGALATFAAFVDGGRGSSG
jgi:hypothetical protein